MHASTVLSKGREDRNFRPAERNSGARPEMSRRIAGEPGSPKSWSARTTSEANLRFDGRTPKNSVSWSVISKALAAIPCALLPLCTSAPNGFKATSGPVSPRVAPLLRRLYWCSAFPWSHPKQPRTRGRCRA